MKLTFHYPYKKKITNSICSLINETVEGDSQLDFFFHLLGIEILNLNLLTKVNRIIWFCEVELSLFEKNRK